MSSSAIREILKVTQRADVISFAGGLPAPKLLRLPEVRGAVDRVLTDHGAALQYSTTEGHPPLGKRIARQNRLTPDRLQITSGIQQRLDLLGQVLIDLGDVVLVEQPTYLGALQAFGSYQPRCSNRGRRRVGSWCARRWSRPLRSGDRWWGASGDGRISGDPGW
jgi:2-aminoadipate transaminase